MVRENHHRHRDADGEQDAGRDQADEPHAPQPEARAPGRQAPMRLRTRMHPCGAHTEIVADVTRTVNRSGPMIDQRTRVSAVSATAHRATEAPAAMPRW